MPLVLSEEGEFATAGWTGETAHAWLRRPGASNKAFSMISENETLRVHPGPSAAETLLVQRPMDTPRHHSSVGRAAAL